MPEISEKDPLQTTHLKKNSSSIFQEKNNNNNQLLEIDPSRCKPWKYHNRDMTWLTKERCKDLIHSIQKNGQIEPILVRKIGNDPDYDFEIICGVRRWFACSQIPNQKLLAFLTDADDKKCMVLMHAENAASKDITEFERAISFAQQMKSGLFKNQSEMAEMMGVTQGYISKLIKAGEIFEHEWIKNLFQNTLDIPVKYAYALSIMLKNPVFYNYIKKEANSIQIEKEKIAPLLTANTILKRLINVNKPISQPIKKTMLSVDNKPIVSCYRDKLGNVSLLVNNSAKNLHHLEVETACIKAIRDYIFK